MKNIKTQNKKTYWVNTSRQHTSAPWHTNGRTL